ncbi:SusD/RagB family nutrient-binding outer membrane lipoprotein [Flavisolibacter sp. BT320]|nr:SusD/RagB family nutrient-binding outer membrane lipoprotein [Flavisolibacter longurius]
MTIRFSAILLVGALLLGGCTKDYLDLNDNPNQTTNPPLNGLLARVTSETGLNVYRAGSVSAYYVQQLSSPNASSGSDTYDNVDRSTLWYNIYNTMQDGRVMLEKANAVNAYQHIGVSKVMEAMNLDMLVDFWGDAPYSGAFDLTNFKPAYDNGQELYNAALRLLDEGLAEFGKANPAVQLDAASDVIHNGSIPNWIKTANALKARMLNKVSKTASYNPTAILDALSKAYTANADDAQINTFVGRSPWNQVAFNNTQLLLDGWLSEQFVDHLDGTTYGVFDPRIKYITDTTRFGDYRGTPNGRGRTGTGTNRDESYLSLNGFYSKNGAPLLLVTYAEMKFIEAEVTFATDKARSYQAYLDGIAANMTKLGVPANERNDYLANPAVAVGPANLTKGHIFKEKYTALFLHPEAWVDARRFDYMYKDFSLPQNALLPSYIRRVGYPSTETDRNGENVPAIGTFADKLWWDQ